MAPVQHVVYGVAQGRALRAALALPPRDGRRRPGVIVIHELLGLTEDIRRITARVASLGYVAICPDLFDRPGLRALCILRTLIALRRGEGAAWEDLDAARLYLSRRSDVDSSRLGVIGFCMGGGFALLYALRQPVNVVGTFYGEVPQTAEELRGICPVVGGYGAVDRVFGGNGDKLNAMLDELGVAHDVETYERAGHSYMSAHSGWKATLGAWSPLKVDYDPQASEDSWRRIERYFHRYLR